MRTTDTHCNADAGVLFQEQVRPTAGPELVLGESCTTCLVHGHRQTEPLAAGAKQCDENELEVTTDGCLVTCATKLVAPRKPVVTAARLIAWLYLLVKL